MYIKITNIASKKIKYIYENNKNYNFIRIYIIGGGCNGFLYDFYLDNFNKYNDICLNKEFNIISDYISFNYLKNSLIDYNADLMNSFFFIKNPNIKSTCSCGKSFNI